LPRPHDSQRFAPKRRATIPIEVAALAVLSLADTQLAIE
jgi:hypothetical protein